MELLSIQTVALVTSLTFMLAQLLVKNKQLPHILFAVFCGSIAISVVKDMPGEAIGPYKYLIGMGACATCNCYWLLARSMFRENNAIAIHHIIIAGSIALLIMLNQGYLFASSANLVGSTEGNLTPHIIRELTILLSSCILVLSFWEACRGLSGSQGKERWQRIMFLFTFGGAVSISKVSEGLFVGDPNTQTMATTFIILFVLVNTQLLIYWRFTLKSVNKAASTVGHEQIQENAATPMAAQKANCLVDNESNTTVASNEVPSVDETTLALQVKTLITEQQLFLQANLKIADVARALNVSEYRVSNALRYHLQARNFNQYINEFRIQHAQTLLADFDKRKWSVLVIGLESGFASVGPFTRSFKAMTGYTPNQYRQQLNQVESA